MRNNKVDRPNTLSNFGIPGPHIFVVLFVCLSTRVQRRSSNWTRSSCVVQFWTASWKSNLANICKVSAQVMTKVELVVTLLHSLHQGLISSDTTQPMASTHTRHLEVSLPLIGLADNDQMANVCDRSQMDGSERGLKTIPNK